MVLLDEGQPLGGSVERRTQQSAGDLLEPRGQ